MMNANASPHLAANKPALELKVMATGSIKFDGPIRFVALPGFEGELGILPKRQPLVLRLKPGKLRFERENGEKEELFISGGIAYNDGRQVTVLIS